MSLFKMGLPLDGEEAEAEAIYSKLTALMDACRAATFAPSRPSCPLPRGRCLPLPRRPYHRGEHCGHVPSHPAQGRELGLPDRGGRDRRGPLLGQDGKVMIPARGGLTGASGRTRQAALSFLLKHPLRILYGIDVERRRVGLVG